MLYYEYPLFTNEIDGKVLACNERITVDTLQAFEWTVTYGDIEFISRDKINNASEFYEGFLCAKRTKG